MQLVYAKGTAWVTPSVQLHEGEAWVADDPLVKRRPDLFTDTPKIVRTTLTRQQIAERDEAPVEQATRAPGERRATRRPRKRAEQPPPQPEQEQEATPEGDDGDQ
jgi:hypothetical protein